MQAHSVTHSLLVTGSFAHDRTFSDCEDCAQTGSYLMLACTDGEGR